ncbi:MAG: RNA polymerase sigma factor [Thermoanaerobaculia bacterium]
MAVYTFDMGPMGDDDSPRSAPPVVAAAVEEAYRNHADLLRDIAEKKFNIPPLDATGVVNEVVTAYIVRRDSVRDARQWLIGAVCHASRAYWREASRTTSLPADVGEYIDPASPGLEGRIVDRVTMAAALRTLGPKCREILSMYYSEGYSTAEIAARLGTTSGYVTQLLHTCRKRVRKAYDKLLEDAKR